MLAFAVWLLLDIPIVGMPFKFLATWAHEVGHGLGAIFSGGTFVELKLFPNFSGLAKTQVFDRGDRILVLMGGLLGPTFAGMFMLILTRGFNLYRIALGLTFVMLLITLIFWAGTSFTFWTILLATLITGGITIKGPDFLVFLVSHIIAIAYCVNAVAHFDYFFWQGSAQIGGKTYRTDMTTLSEMLFGGHTFWAVILSGFSILMMVFAIWFSGKLASKAQARRLEKPKVIY